MNTKYPIMFFKRIGGKTFAKLENMVAEDREFTSQLIERVDDMLSEPDAVEREEYIRTLVKGKSSGRKAS